MKIRRIHLDPYNFTYVHGYRRLGALLKVENEDGAFAVGDLAPLPERSKESLLQATEQLTQFQPHLTSIVWNKHTFLEQLANFQLYPSLAFAIESALFSLLMPQRHYTLDVAALLMGNSVRQILDIATVRKNEGFATAKLKIGNLSVEDAFTIINEIKGVFRLRVDANSRWSLSDSIRFFSRFPIETFDYIEDPVNSIQELHHFPFPAAVEEAISRGSSLSSLETIPNLKAVTYKPSVQGGYLVGAQLKKWTDQQGISLVLSSSLESDLGHFHLIATAARLNLTSPIGIGTYHYLSHHLSDKKINFSNGKVTI